MNHLLRNIGIERTSDFPVVIKDDTLFKQYIRLHANRLLPDEVFLADFVWQLFSKTNQNIDRDMSVIPEKIIAVKRYLSEQLNQKLHLENVSSIHGINKYQLIRQFKQHIGVTSNTYLTILRIEKAKNMINNGYPIVEAALEAGFDDQSHFHHSFLYYTGVTPGNFSKLLI
ncbi:AraC family transcriptional regulator [Pedobacter sp. UYP1]|uniref:helix-turn-helix transcriptional regulator n=1 Tax=Pedobacter sp. UYP1 TaxID=1756396 RepID=UPI00339569E0